MKRILKIVLTIVIFFLCYLIYHLIRKPIDFEKEKDRRYSAVITRLIDIRKAEYAYKDVYGKYTDNFDTLIHFVSNDSFPIITKKGSVSDIIDSILLKDKKITTEQVEQFAIKAGRIIRDTIKVSVLDSIFGKGFKVDSLKYIPFSFGKTFMLGAGTIETKSRVKIHVFQAYALNEDFLKGLSEKYIYLLNENSVFPGLKVGSLSEASDAGNWE